MPRDLATALAAERGNAYLPAMQNAARSSPGYGGCGDADGPAGAISLRARRRASGACRCVGNLTGDLWRPPSITSTAEKNTRL